MRGLRILASIVLGLIAIFVALVAIASSDKSMYDDTIKSGREIQSAFLTAAARVDAQIVATGAPPTPEEFAIWASSYPSRPHSIKGMRLELPPFSSELLAEYGTSPVNAYVLSYRRGDWEEHYISWAKKSTVVLDRSAFFWFGSQLIQVITMCVIALGLAVCAFATWPRKPRANPAPAPA